MGTPEAWDVVVVGAGPAGASAAREVRRRSDGRLSVLLVEKAEFPRRKVCGCFLNGSAVATLRSMGLGDLPSRCNAPTVTRMQLANNGSVAAFPLTGGVGLSRESLDTQLVKEAVRAGVVTYTQTHANLDTANADGCWLQLTSSHRAELNGRVVHCKCLIAADGLSGRLLRDFPGIDYEVAPESLIGAATFLVEAPSGYTPETVTMAVGAEGYVGTLVLEDRRLDIACAFQAKALKKFGPAKLATRITEQSGLPELTDLENTKWLGTPPVSRKAQRPAFERVFLIGDSAGYVEPFTGEGMAWALASGRAVADCAIRVTEHYSPEIANEWLTVHRSMFNRKQRWCRLITRSLRHSIIARTSVLALRTFPGLAAPVVRQINTPPSLPQLQ